MKEQIFLDGKWQLLLVENNKLNDKSITSLNDISERDGLLIEATVPGNFELDLFKAGIEKDPYVDANIYDYYKYENRHLFYFRKFSVEDKNFELCFDGIDTISEVYLNGNLVLKTDNMMLEYKADVENFLKQDNELLVHIKPVTIEARKYEYSMRAWQNGDYDSVGRSIRKPAHTFGWDILPRAVSGGIFKSCYLLRKKDAFIKDVCYFPTKLDYENNTACVSFVYNLGIKEDFLKDYEVQIVGKCNDSEFSYKQSIWHTSNLVFEIPVKNCYFWNPKNYGEPYLYEVKFSLLKNGTLLDDYSFNMGIRMVELIRSSIVEKGGAFYFKVNGQKIFSLGTNWIPLDSYHSKDKERLSSALPLLTDLNCNIVRCWGGNLYEDHEFFDFCDKNGIMVWQDFSMGCGLYPNDPEFLQRMREEAIFIVKKLRNHPSLCLWAGDNECDLFASWVGSNPNDMKVTRQIFPDVIKDYDFLTPYLPSSPYIDETAYKTKQDTSETHSWGLRDYFKSEFYRDATAYFQSEIGYQATPSPASLIKYISKEYLFPWEDKKLSEKYGTKMPNDSWSAHTPNVLNKPTPLSFILPLTDKHIKNLFGEEPSNLTDYAHMSQISQAEAFKYFIERVRIRKADKSGIIWWNLLDGYPTHSNAVVDYYFVKKLAYYFIKRSQQPLALMFDEPKGNSLSLYAVSELNCDKKVSFTVTDITKNQQLVSKTVTVKKGDSFVVCKLKNIKDKDFLLISYEYDGLKFSNHYMCNMPNIDFKSYMSDLKKAGLDDFEGF